ncbi:transporter associated domain-containing protein [Virgibacillus indicus]|uniref:transporter associated domain-containing protein n=1 Tax=Virgibacillus indicus TaxID=2024554 RepID=UPI001F0A6292|nr:transporter associated domain-containing protein [Virgibacillus indicus]
MDEYGGTESLVTIEDVIEEIVGEIFSESNEPGVTEEEIKEIEPNKYELEGIYHLWELEEAFNTEFPTEDFDTVKRSVDFLLTKLGIFLLKMNVRL